MKIDNIPASYPHPTYTSAKATSANFPDYLAENAGSKKKNDTSDSYKADMDAIRKKGFLKYVEELREEKMREKILRQRGLTEEDLANMTTEQRAKIEEIIADEIRKRLAAESELNRKDKNANLHLTFL